VYAILPSGKMARFCHFARWQNDKENIQLIKAVSANTQQQILL